MSAPALIENMAYSVVKSNKHMNSTHPLEICTRQEPTQHKFIASMMNFEEMKMDEIYRLRMKQFQVKG